MCLSAPKTPTIPDPVGPPAAPPPPTKTAAKVENAATKRKKKGTGISGTSALTVRRPSVNISSTGSGANMSY